MNTNGLRILREGTRGRDVAQLQMALGLEPDGNFGPLTLAAVKKFQRESGLVIDGLVGAKTFEKLHEAVIQWPDASHGITQDLSTLRGIQACFEEGTAEFNEACYKILMYDPGYKDSIAFAARRVLERKLLLYLPLERQTGIPWAMTAVIHSMECNNDPLGVLHNGQKIIGTARKTTIVPKGRGPFNLYRGGATENPDGTRMTADQAVQANWLMAAKDAISLDPRWKVPNWTIGMMLRQIERFNGLGYVKGAGAAELSPYLWARTNINDGRGKYVADGRFDPTADANTQVGAAAILKELELTGHFNPTYMRSL